MALHLTGATSQRDQQEAELLVRPLPLDLFPAEGQEPALTAAILTEELLLDGNSKQNLATFCQTCEEPEVHALMDLGLDKNLIDKDEYPQTAELERRCVSLLADLWHAPAGATGCSTIGSSEAAMLGGMAAKWRWRAARRAAGLPADKPNMVCGSVQICWHKFARYWDIELREITMTPGRLCITPADVLAQVDENTIMVVPTLGVTYHGLYEDVAAISAALDDLQARTGLDVPIHVDAASGGFLAPFTAPDLPPWDFRLERVKSINASGHKYGLAPLGVGWVLWRQASDLPRELVFSVSYLGGDMPTFQINFSRPAGQVIAQYYTFVRLGREGYRLTHGVAYQVARYLAAELARLPLFSVLHDGDPAKGIPAVVWQLQPGTDPGFSLYDLADRLRSRGWQVPAYPFTGALASQAFQRIMVRRGFSRDMADLLLQDIRQAIDHFEQHPISVPLSAAEAASYNHL
ncbi:glutamate decarboxylase [Cyanobium sp. NS01]|uniref:glutamate decarboxylase n=1 Tax=Cyanobium sp. NS01 TaxID=261284 RepID=UPI001647A06B|nr:glutamate decarboxylase [Cyanobium sp. NS01]QNI71147.1 glutamate decarboxylase [Cyanobium sp. NS01]